MKEAQPQPPAANPKIEKFVAKANPRNASLSSRKGLPQILGFDCTRWAAIRIRAGSFQPCTDTIQDRVGKQFGITNCCGIATIPGKVPKTAKCNRSTAKGYAVLAIRHGFHRHERHSGKNKSHSCASSEGSEETQAVEGKQSAQQSCEVVVFTGRAASEASNRFCCAHICGIDGRMSGAALREEVTPDDLRCQRCAAEGGWFMGSFGGDCLQMRDYVKH